MAKNLIKLNVGPNKLQDPLTLNVGDVLFDWRNKPAAVVVTKERLVSHETETVIHYCYTLFTNDNIEKLLCSERLYGLELDLWALGYDSVMRFEEKGR
jgi:hypothetical protein